MVGSRFLEWWVVGCGLPSRRIAEICDIDVKAPRFATYRHISPNVLGFFGFAWASMDFPISRRSICVAPVRGGSHFLCCCKESNQRNSYPHPKYFTPAPAQKNDCGPAVASALTGLTGLGSRTVCHIAPLN